MNWETERSEWRKRNDKEDLRFMKAFFVGYALFIAALIVGNIVGSLVA